jgi:hypothetical protein
VRIDYEDLNWIDADYLDAHRARTLTLDPPCGDHDAVVVATACQWAWIDADIAELMYLMWGAGIRTEESCQDIFESGDPASAEVYFGLVDVSDLVLLLKLVLARTDDSTLADLMMEADVFQISIQPVTLVRELRRLRPLVQFPLTYVPVIVGALRHAGPIQFAEDR